MDMHKTILLVEDDPDEMLLAKRAFAKAGLYHALQLADGGREACRLLQSGTLDTLPSLVLLDLQMPGKDGLAVLRELRSCMSPAQPIVVLSSSDEPRDIVAAYAAGANSYLRKPVDFDLFVQLVRDIHAYWLQHNLLPQPRGAQ